jgi:Sulfatase-modifying factor enzyme 1
VLRGGSWNNDSTNCRCAYRNNNTPDNRNNNIGFRLVLSSPEHSARRFRLPEWPNSRIRSARREVESSAVVLGPDPGIPKETEMQADW